MKSNRILHIALALAAVSLLLSLAFLNTCGDDSFIYFRLIENYLQTGRLEYNPSEPCYAMTSTTYFFVFAELARWLGLQGGRYAVSLLGHAFAVVALAGLGRRLIRNRGVWALALAAILFDPFYLRWFWAGWELSFKIGAAALALWMLLAAGSRDGARPAFIAGLAMAFAALTRPEMFFLTGLGAAYLVVRKGISRPAEWLSALMAYAVGWLLLAGPWLLFAKAYFGWAVPHTVYAKASGTLFYWPYLRIFFPKFLKILLLPAFPFYLLVLVAVLSVRPWKTWTHCAFRGWSPDFRDFLVVALWASMVGGYLARGVYIDSIKVGLFAPFFVLVAGALLDAALRLRNREPSAKSVAAWIFVLLALSIAFQSRLFYRFSSWRPQYAQGDDANLIAFAQRIRERTPPDARIGIFELGVIGYYSGRYMIDYAGLATPQLVTYQLETGSKEAAVATYYERHGGPASHIVQTFPGGGAPVPETRDFWGYPYRLIDSEPVRRISGAAGKDAYAIYALYALAAPPASR